MWRQQSPWRTASRSWCSPRQAHTPRPGQPFEARRGPQPQLHNIHPLIHWFQFPGANHKWNHARMEKILAYGKDYSFGLHGNIDLIFSFLAIFFIFHLHFSMMWLFSKFNFIEGCHDKCERMRRPSLYIFVGNKLSSISSLAQTCALIIYHGVVGGGIYTSGDLPWSHCNLFHHFNHNNLQYFCKSISTYFYIFSCTSAD